MAKKSAAPAAVGKKSFNDTPNLKGTGIAGTDTRLIVLYGPAGTGKTTAASSIQGAKWIVTDSNCVPTLQILDRLPESDSAWDCKSLADVRGALNQMLDAGEKGDRWPATVFDSFTQMSHWHQADVAKAHGQSYMGENPKDGGWNHFNAELGNIVDLCASLSKYVNVVIIAHAKEKFQPTKGQWSGLNLPGSNSDRLAQAANWVLFTSMNSFVIEDGEQGDEFSEIVESNGSRLKIVREIHTKPIGNWITKVNARNLRPAEPMDLQALLSKEGLL